MKAVQKKWLTILGLAVLFHQAGVSISLTSTFFIAWLDGDVLHQTCTYDQCPLKYDIWYWCSWILVALGSFLVGYLMYCFIKKIWNWEWRKNAATS